MRNLITKMLAIYMVTQLVSCSSEGVVVTPPEDDTKSNDTIKVEFENAHLMECNIIKSNSTIFSTQKKYEFDSVYVEWVVFHYDSMQYSGFFSFDKTRSNCLDCIFEPIHSLSDGKNPVEFYADLIHFYNTGYPISFAIIKFDPYRRISKNKIPNACDTTGNVLFRNFYYIDSSGMVHNFDEYASTFEKECSAYSRISK